MVMIAQALIFALFGAFLAAMSSGYGHEEVAVLYLLAGAFLFFAGLGASKGGRVASAIALLIEATYLTTLGTGTAGSTGYYSWLNVPFWIALCLAAIAVLLILGSWFREEDNERWLRGRIAACILVVAVLLGIGWYLWVVVPNLPREM